jgi:hypothetical protein
MPAWARKQTRSDAGPGPGSNNTSSSATTAGPAARRRASSIQSTTGTAVGGRPSAVARGESMSRRAGGSAGAGGGAAATTAAGGAAGKQGAGMKKTEYMGPDGDLVTNLERDVLDRSPGIRCVLLLAAVCTLAGHTCHSAAGPCVACIVVCVSETSWHDCRPGMCLPGSCLLLAHFDAARQQRHSRNTC